MEYQRLQKYLCVHVISYLGMFITVFLFLIEGVYAQSTTAQPYKAIGIFVEPSIGIKQVIKREEEKLQKGKIKEGEHKHDYPYILLYLIDYPQSAISEVKSRIKEVAKRQAVFNLKLDGKERLSDKQCVLLFKDINDLQALSDRIAEKLSSLHGRRPEKSRIHLGVLQKRFVVHQDEQGFSFQFSPYVALPLSSEKAVEAYHNMPWKEDMSGHAISLILGYTDASGALIKKIATFPLKRNEKFTKH